MIGDQTTTKERLIGTGWEGSGCPVIVRGTTAEYRRVLQTVAREDNLAVEIGSAAGVTTKALARRCHRVIGIDAAPGEVEGAMAANSHPNLTYLVAKIRSGTECRKSLGPLSQELEKNGKNLRDVSLLAVDIAGTSPIEEVAPLVISLRQIMRPQITVVKSIALRKFIVALNAGENSLLHLETTTSPSP